MQLLDGSKLYLISLGATKENHLRQLTTESARKYHAFFFFLGSRSGHLKTPMTKYDFFFLYQGCHDRTPQKHLKIILAHNICRNSVAQLFTAHVKQSALKTVKVGQRKTKT